MGNAAGQGTQFACVQLQLLMHTVVDQVPLLEELDCVILRRHVLWRAGGYDIAHIAMELAVARNPRTRNALVAMFSITDR